ncbi:MAG: gamma-glutamylcyclotransferase [Congregibacter sp.]
MQHWVFGYGSLIYKVDFPVLRREAATLTGWERRFWQGSHDHRGTPDAPGRVVTLTPAPGSRCKGIAYLVDEEVFEHLDHREKNGYERHETELLLHKLGRSVPATFYIGRPDNPAFLGDARKDELVSQIAQARGPSGKNADYLLALAAALRSLDEQDPHVFALEDALLRESPQLTPHPLPDLGV